MKDVYLLPSKTEKVAEIPQVYAIQIGVSDWIGDYENALPMKRFYVITADEELPTKDEILAALADEDDYRLLRKLVEKVPRELFDEADKTRVIPIEYEDANGSYVIVHPIDVVALPDKRQVS